MNREEVDALEKLARFVTGEITPADFQHALGIEPVFAKLLVYRKPPRHAGGTSSSYEFLLEMDSENPYKVADAREHARAVLLDLGRDVRVDRSDEPMRDAIMRLQPSWVEVPPAMMRSIIESAGDRRGEPRHVNRGAKCLVPARIPRVT